MVKGKQIFCLILFFLGCPLVTDDLENDIIDVITRTNINEDIPQEAWENPEWKVEL